MNKNLLHEHVNEILDIAEANNRSWDEGAVMFLNNCQDVGMEGDQAFYHGADGVDYAALHKVCPAKGTDEATEMLNAFIEDYRAREDAITRLRAAGDTEGVKDVMLRA